MILPKFVIECLFVLFFRLFKPIILFKILAFIRHNNQLDVITLLVTTHSIDVVVKKGTKLL